MSEAEDLWYDTTRWPAWMDGVAHVQKVDALVARQGRASVVWDSPPAGRGRVIEIVTRYEMRVGQTLAVEDETGGDAVGCLRARRRGALRCR